MSLVELSERMRSDWNRRISHDYRFWMSDGYASDAIMWESGSRDYQLLMQNFQIQPGQVFLEIGCGVGRLLKPALKDFARVIGLDISNEAISRATELLGSPFNLELQVNSGLALEGINKHSVDVVASFAAIGSIPTAVVAKYLLEVHRVLKNNGTVRFQMYLGKNQEVGQDDTLYLRCYQADCAIAAFTKAGFDVEWIRELNLPFQASSPELGVQAVIISLKKADRNLVTAEEVAKTLLPSGESVSVGVPIGQDLEYLMLLNYAKESAENGNLEKAELIIKQALSLNSGIEADPKILLQSLIGKDIAQKEVAPSSQISFSSDSIFDSNIRVIQDRFKNAACLIEQLQTANSKSYVIEQTEDGPVLSLNLQNLDHPSKPKKASERWVSQLMTKINSDTKVITIVGAGMGYHLEALLDSLKNNQSKTKIELIEPSLDALRAAFENRDCRDWLSRIDSIQAGPAAQVSEDSTILEFRIQSSSLFPDFCDRLRSSFFGRQGFSSLKPSIGVVGPFHGGTLPIMQYVTLSLQLLGQRVRTIDVSCFDNGYGQLSNFVKDKLRRTPVENMYYEMVSQIVLESVTEKPVDILFCMALAPISPRVLNELRARGVITVLWFVEDYQRFTYWQQVAAHFDYVFCIQKDKCISAIRQAGAKEVHYMPVACEQNVHAPLVLSEADKAKWGSDLSFMGAGYHNRQQMFASLVDFNLKIWGTEWPDCKPFDRMVQDGGQRLAPSDYVKIFNSSKINLNLHSSNEKDGVDPFGDFVNPRTFELASAGAFQLVDNRSLLPELFDVGKELITFENANDLKEKISYYLNHDQERQEIAKRSRARVLREHTYQHRVRDMLSIIYSRSFEQLKIKQDQAPWAKLIKKAEPHSELALRCQKAFERGEQPNLDGLISDIIAGQGKLSETEKKLLFMFHLKKQIVRHAQQDAGEG
jgi:spore maturation protein CgeB